MHMVFPSHDNSVKECMNLNRKRNCEAILKLRIYLRCHFVQGKKS